MWGDEGGGGEGYEGDRGKPNALKSFDFKPVLEVALPLPLLPFAWSFRLAEDEVRGTPVTAVIVEAGRER